MKKSRGTDTPYIVIDNSLEKYKDQVLFPEKLDKANDMLKKVGLPKPKNRKRSVAG